MAFIKCSGGAGKSYDFYLLHTDNTLAGDHSLSEPLTNFTWFIISMNQVMDNKKLILNSSKSLLWTIILFGDVNDFINNSPVTCYSPKNSPAQLGTVIVTYNSSTSITFNQTWARPLYIYGLK